MSSDYQEIKSHYGNGRLKEHGYRLNRQRHGEHTWWYRNGQMSSHATFVKNQLNGSYMRWHDSGQVAEESFFLNNKRQGECKMFHSSGELYLHRFYKDDVDISKKILSDFDISNLLELTEEQRLVIALRY